MIPDARPGSSGRARARARPARGHHRARGFRRGPGFRFRRARATQVSLRAAEWPAFDKLTAINPTAVTERRGSRRVDLQLMVFFNPRRADNRTFRPPVTQNQKTF